MTRTRWIPLHEAKAGDEVIFPSGRRRRVLRRTVRPDTGTSSWVFKRVIRAAYPSQKTVTYTDSDLAHMGADTAATTRPPDAG